MSFDKLISDMGALQKSLPKNDDGAQDDKKILNAADGDGGLDGVDDDDENIDGAGDENKGGANPDEEEGLTKSFSFQLENGDTLEAYDGTTMLKALSSRLDATDGQLADANLQMIETHQKIETVLTKSFELMSAQQAQIEKQEQLIKSLQSDLARVGSQGRGRVSVTSVSQVPAKAPESDLKKSFGDCTPTEFLGKCLSAQKAGRITAMETALAEEYVNAGVPLPESLTSRVIG